MSKVVLVSDQPVLLSGFAHVLESRGFETLTLTPGSDIGYSIGLAARPDLVLLDITAGLTFGTLTELHTAIPDAPVVLWADSMPLELIFKTLEFGVRGIVPRTSHPDQLAESLHRVLGGEMHIGFTGAAAAGPAKRNVSLTPREREIVMHLRQGLRNKQIATEMNITEGTVKIYLFRLFHKLGVRNRFELARSGAASMALFDGRSAPEPLGAYRTVPVM
ncbi:MAG TPA: response regulator transcription factor [Bryobacteraceae bacterium]|nr:response regulator transcription factor [Bryobacteraceae bacterium]